jgi:regulator of replication initiation timing
MLLKKNSSKSIVKNIITLNPYTDKKYIFKSDTFKPLNKYSYNTSNFITSYISNKDLISTTVYLSRNIPNEDIADILDIKAYEELGLDQAINYVVSSAEVETAAEEREFHIFVVQPEVLNELYLPIKGQTKYIDLIVPAPLLYKALYRREILQDNRTHCFIYFTPHDAFVTFYSDGEFIYSKSIEFSLNQIYDKYCELADEKIDEKDFFTIFKTEGLKTANSEYQQNLTNIFSEIFITINDILIYAKRAFKVETVDHVFVGSVNGPIVGLAEYSENFLGLKSSDFNFNYNVNNDEWYIDQLQFLMLLNTLDYMEDKKSVINLTIFPRAPSFMKRASGQFIVATSAAILLGLAPTLGYLVGSYINDAKIHLLINENNKLTVEFNKYKKILGAKKKEITALDEKIVNVSKIYSGKTKTLRAIYDKKVNYRLKSETFHTIANDLNKFDVHIDTMFSKDDILWLSIVSPDDRKLTELIKYISDTHFDVLSQIDIELIEKDPESSYYKGLLKVELK